MPNKSEIISGFCDRIVYCAIILLPFVASFSSAGVDAMIGISGFFFLLKKILRKDRSLVNIPILGAFICLIVISLVSFFNTINLKSSIQGIEKLLKYGILFVTVADSLKDKKHLK